MTPSALLPWPGLVLVVGAFLLPLCPGRSKKAAQLLVPLISYAFMLALPVGGTLALEVMGWTLTPVRIDKLSLVFGHVFHIAAFLSALYALHVDDNLQALAGSLYAGAAIGAAFAGDLITLFIYWELTAASSVFLLWAARTPRSARAGLRYLVIQVLSGLLLLLGVLAHLVETGSIAFEHLGLETPGGKLIFLAFGIKCAFPLLHNWVQDAYPEATVTGTVVLSAFTTKLAVYALARGYAGTELLVPIGTAMTLFPIVYAVIENDLRRVLAYSLNNQLGFMVVGIGVGTELALNGAAAHAFAHILYKSLLFMAMGAVLFRTGTANASELGGLWKRMPVTTIFCIIGSLSISGFPLFSGFVSKAMTLTAVADQHLLWVSLALLFASAGVVDHSGIKIPFFAFFAHDQGRFDHVCEAPLNMLFAMGGAAALCIGIGVYPSLLYELLPYPVDYAPYTMAHVVDSLQLLLFAAFAFALLWRTGRYPPEMRATNLDTDWLYRRLGYRIVLGCTRACRVAHGVLAHALDTARVRLVSDLRNLAEPPEGPAGEPWSTSTTALWAAIALCVTLLLYFV